MPSRDRILKAFSLFLEVPLPLLPVLLEILELPKPRSNKRNLRPLKRRRMLIWVVFSTNELYFM
jgi:hypothetical protein